MARIRKSAVEEERMTNVNIQRVIEMLVDEVKPWTKKEACSFLGMSYNTSRLANIIQSFQEKEAHNKSMRAAKRGKPLSDEEVLYIIQSYINGDTFEGIAKELFRTSALVKKTLLDNSITIRPLGHSYFVPPLIPDAAVRDRFAIGETVYSAQYNDYAEVKAEHLHDTHGYVYRVRLLGEHQQNAYVPAYELASLDSIRKMGVKI